MVALRVAVQGSHPDIRGITFLGIRSNNLGPVKMGQSVTMIRLLVSPGSFSSAHARDEIKARVSDMLELFNLDNTFVDLESAG
eukprot:scaffold2008_cov283-Pinguiococcus_pyrenoidosus.AAC.6